MSGGSATQQFLLSLSLQRTLVVALLKGWEVEVSLIHNLENNLYNNPVGFFMLYILALMQRS